MFYHDRWLTCNWFNQNIKNLKSRAKLTTTWKNSIKIKIKKLKSLQSNCMIYFF
jgi:hypothetical protein